MRFSMFVPSRMRVEVSVLDTGLTRSVRLSLIRADGTSDTVRLTAAEAARMLEAEEYLHGVGFRFNVHGLPSGADYLEWAGDMTVIRSSDNRDRFVESVRFALAELEAATA